MKKQEQSKRLDQALSAYAGAFRWGNYETARAFTSPRDGSAPKSDLDALAGLKVTGYSVRINRINEAGDEADTSFSFTYYFEDSASVKRADQNAIWYWDEARQSWLIDGTLPEFSR